MTKAVSAIIEDFPLEFSKEKYIEYRLAGFSPFQASQKAGYRSHNDYMKWESDEDVRQALALIQQEQSRERIYTRDKVMEIIESAVYTAQLQGDARTMIAGAQEFNKMQGFYAPEKRSVDLNVEYVERVRKIQEMDENELLEALDREKPYIDAEFSELPDEEYGQLDQKSD